MKKKSRNNLSQRRKERQGTRNGEPLNLTKKFMKQYDLKKFYAAVMLGALVFVVGPGLWALPAGYLARPVTVITNDGTVYFGTQALSRLTLTNSFQFSNGATVFITGAGALTNDGPTTLSNATARGAVYITAAGLLTNDGPTTLSNLTVRAAQTNSAPLFITSAGALTNYGVTALSNVTVRGEQTVDYDTAWTPTKIAASTITNNDYNVTNTSYVLITNVSVQEIVFTGFAGGRAGQHLVVVNMTDTNMNFQNSSTSSSLTNRLDLMGLGTTNTVGKGTAAFIFAETNWCLKSIIY